MRERRVEYPNRSIQIGARARIPYGLKRKKDRLFGGFRNVSAGEFAFIILDDFFERFFQDVDLVLEFLKGVVLPHEFGSSLSIFQMTDGWIDMFSK